MFKKLIIGVLIVIVAVSIYFAYVFTGMDEKLNAVTISDITLDDIEDGLYIGEERVGLVGSVVEVEVQDHQITNIRLVDHRNWRGKPAEVIIDDVIDKQSLNVELISGATASSKVILKSIENSLIK